MGRVHTMMVLRKINNNVSLCRGGSHRELAVFGKGIGFPHTPYELTGLSLIERTFYNVNSKYIPLLAEIPPEVIQFTAEQLQAFQDELPCEVSSNLIFTLPDHIAFAVERAGRGICVQMPSIYELEMNYPAEVQGIAMHLINARDQALDEPTVRLEKQYEDILAQISAIIEEEIGVRVRRDTFNYARFATHVQYLLKQVFEQKHIDSENLQMYQSMRKEYPDISACVDEISRCLKESWSVELAEEEKLYLMLHVNRVCSKESI